MFSISQVVEDYQINPMTFLKLLQKTEELYSLHSNPYHNFKHAIAVLNNVYSLLRTTILSQYFSKIGIAALMFSALMHDIEHTGRNNLFEINTFSKLAVRYNDNSILENHHCARAFKILEEKEQNIFQNMHQSEYPTFRNYVVKAILSTDIKKHFPELAAFKGKLDLGNFTPYELESPKDFLLMIGVILHTCDLYIYSLDPSLCAKWCHLIKEEFSAQSAYEKERNLPLTSFYLNLDKIDVQARSEVSFIQGIVYPIWLEVDRFLKGALADKLENIDNALAAWKRIKEAEGTQETVFEKKLKNRKIAFGL